MIKKTLFVYTVFHMGPKQLAGSVVLGQGTYTFCVTTNLNERL